MSLGDDAIANRRSIRSPSSPFSFVCLFLLLVRSTSHVINNTLFFTLFPSKAHIHGRSCYILITFSLSLMNMHLQGQDSVQNQFFVVKNSKNIYKAWLRRCLSYWLNFRSHVQIINHTIDIKQNKSENKMARHYICHIV